MNAGVAIRPRPADFARWGARSAGGWSFADVLPAFKLMENNPGGEDAYHGRTGPLPVRQLTDEELTPSQAGFIGAAVARGFKRVRDFNGADQDGVSGHSVNVVNGIRENAAIVFLTAEVRRRPSLAIRGDVTIDRVLFGGTAATGVVAADGTVYRAGEVILSAGSYGSPAILLRSGAGPADELTALGIGVVAGLPVGRRLLDHPYFHTAHALAPGHLEMTPAAGAILWAASSEAAPGELDLNITATHLIPPSYSPAGGVLALSASVVLPESTGTLKLASRDPGVAPLIDCNPMTLRATSGSLALPHIPGAAAGWPGAAVWTCRRTSRPASNTCATSPPSRRAARWRTRSTACSSCMATATSRTPYGSRPEPKSHAGREPQRSGSLAARTDIRLLTAADWGSTHMLWCRPDAWACNCTSSPP